MQFPDMNSYERHEQKVLEQLRTSDGQDDVVIYIADQRAMKRLGPGWRVAATQPLTRALSAVIGQNNVKVVEQKLANRGKRD